MAIIETFANESNRLLTKTNYYRISFGLAVFIALVVLFTLQPHGIGISPDSQGYLDMAQSIRNGEFQYLSTQWPPLYPFFISIFAGLFNTDLQSAATYLSAASFSVLVVAVAVLLERFLYNRLLALLGVIVIAFVVHHFFFWAWSEPLFMVFSVLAFIALDSYWKKRRYSALLIAAVVVDSACMTRYIGLSLAIATTLTVFAFHVWRKDGWKVIIGRTVLFFFFAIFMISVRMLQNIISSGGVRAITFPPQITFTDSLGLVAQTAQHWLMPGTVGGLFNLILLLVPLTVLALYIILPKYPTLRERYKFFLPMAVFALSYLAFLIWNALTVYLDSVWFRYLVPLAAPFFIFILIGVDSLIKSQAYTKRVWQWGIALFAIGLTVTFLTNFREMVNDIQRVRSQKLEYSLKEWIGDPLISYLEDHPEFWDACSAYINDIAVSQFFAHQMNYVSVQRENTSMDAIAQALTAQDNSCLIWYKPKPSFFSLAELQTVVDMQAIAEFGTEGLYRITSKAKNR